MLLCAAAEGDRLPGRASPAPLNLTASLHNLFGLDAPEATLTSIWRLDDQSGAFRDYISERLADAPAREARQDDGGAGASLVGLMTRIAGIDVRQILMQQTAMTLRPDTALPLAARLVPLFREVAFAPVPPQAGNDAACLADPFIRRHVAGVLDGRVLALVEDDLRTGGTLCRPCLLLGVPLHLNLSPETIASPGFARLTQTVSQTRLRLAVEMSGMDAAADPPLTRFALDLLKQAGIELVLDGIDHAGVTMIDPAVLAPRMVKLSWSARLGDGPRSLLGPIEAAIAAMGPENIILAEADGEAALAWGQSRGIARYQGPFIDAVQAASRTATCHSARACTLRQCTGRSQALSSAVRAGCGNPGLLDLSLAAPPGEASA